MEKIRLLIWIFCSVIIFPSCSAIDQSVERAFDATIGEAVDATLGKGLRSVADKMSAKTRVEVLTNSSKLDLKSTYYINSEVKILSYTQNNNWRRNYLPSTLNRCGINRYRLLGRTQRTLPRKEIEDSYLMVLTVDNCTIKPMDDKATNVYIPATLAVFKLPEKRELIRVVGESQDTKYDRNKIDIESQINELFLEMIDKMSFVSNSKHFNGALVDTHVETEQRRQDFSKKYQQKDKISNTEGSQCQPSEKNVSYKTSCVGSVVEINTDWKYVKVYTNGPDLLNIDDIVLIKGANGRTHNLFVKRINGQYATVISDTDFVDFKIDTKVYLRQME